ncbi:MAG: hypothetical protein HQK76_16970 [Desulfobacterales bacterium]|nr:hypothetical protein [Desulfobacterales bacterium]
MEYFSEEEKEIKKKAIFDGMSEKSKKMVLKKGYEKWDPFFDPKDPIDIRKDKTKRTTQTLVREFLQSRNADDYSAEYGRGVFDICMGIINDSDYHKGMYEFSCWYQELLKKERISINEK